MKRRGSCKAAMVMGTLSIQPPQISLAWLAWPFRSRLQGSLALQTLELQAA